ncbi:hypothetical protein [Acidihalobacter yilgarnensis]|nr:hypothetical protein [Acidihalobacter yilgarnensis]
MKTALPWTGAAICLTVLLAGCGPIRPAHLNDMPGSDRMAPGPGVMDRNSPYATPDGMMIYSDNPNQPSLLGHKPAPSSQQSVTSSAPHEAKTSPAHPTQTPSAASVNEFKAFEAYQQFLRLPKDSKTYRDFQEWLQWRRYETWKDGTPPAQ